ncbi:unnamed protein product [Orchesella dallaii]|uniref:PIN domain-containing protein n=1 Tax=Orchesella dallaii TaxID=48710 RepID=A0ABP1R0J5_9HEXA
MEEMEGHGKTETRRVGSCNKAMLLFRAKWRTSSERKSSFDWIKHFAQMEEPLRIWYKEINHAGTVQETIQNWNLIVPYIENLMRAATKILLNDSSYYLKKELDVRVWKYGVYQFILILRGNRRQSWETEEVHQSFSEVVARGIDHFKNILLQATRALKIDLEPILTATGFLRGSGRKKELSVGEGLLYRLFISLGDLHRYNFEAEKRTCDGKMAVDMYTAARFCDTERSRAYNQLALVAKDQSDIIGTIYNFTRAWSAPVPGDGARDQLLYLYDDIYKEFTAKKNEFWQRLSKKTEEELKTGESRREIWVSPLTPTVSPPAAVKYQLTKQDHFNCLTLNEVLSRFSLAFAHFLGILYTKIGTDDAEDVAKDVAAYFEGLIIHKKFGQFEYLMQVTGLLLFMTDSITEAIETGDPNSGMRSQLLYLRDITTKVTLVMISTLAERIRLICNLLDWDNPHLSSCVAVLHVWCMWAYRRPFVLCELAKSWNKSAFLLLHVHRFKEELLILLARHATFFPKILSSTSGQFPTRNCKYRNCKYSFPLLPEQLVLDGFGDILLPKDYDVRSFSHDGKFSQERAHLHLRLLKIVEFFQNLGEGTVSLLAPSKEDAEISLECKDFLDFIQESLKHTATPKLSKSGGVTRPDSNNARVILKRKSSQLTPSKQSKLSPNTTIYDLWSNLCAMDIKTELVILPLRLVLDTNCFINCLEWIKCLLKLFPRPLYVPTVVISELRGIASGGLRPGLRSRFKELSWEEMKPMMADNLTKANVCSAALDYLNQHPFNFIVVDTRGRKIKMKNFTWQRIVNGVGGDGDKGIPNDEKILETCRQMEAQNDKAREDDTPFRIHRNTVLLTGDRSLRVRAYAADIPARGIQNFTVWLNSFYKRC